MRAQRHLEEDQGECVEHGFLLMLEATVARFSGDLAARSSSWSEPWTIGRRFDDPGRDGDGDPHQGLVLIDRGGDVAEGLALMDEAMTIRRRRRAEPASSPASSTAT